MKPRMNTNKHKGLMILFSVFCLLPSALQAAQIIRYVDPDAAGAGNGTTWADAYTSLSSWEAAEQQDLDTGNNYMTVYTRSSAGTDDTTTCAITGWTTSATDYIEIIGFDFPTDGIYDGTKYVLHNNDASDFALAIVEEFVRVINLQILVTQSTFSSRIGIYITSGGAPTADVRIDSCIIKGTLSGGWSAKGIFTDHPYVTARVYNTVVYGFVNGADTDYVGIYSGASTNLFAYNSTVYGCYNGIERIGGTMTAKNCAVFNNTNDFAGTFSAIDYCASDDGDGTNPQDFTSEATDWNAVFNDYANDDVTLKNYTTSPCALGKGTDDPGAGLYSDDIIGTARSSTWDIGAFEYVAAPPGGGGGQPIIIEME